MSKTEADPASQSGKMAILDQFSAGGVVFRHGAQGVEIVLISVGKPARWQLPKGIVDSGETPESTALREVREEAGVDAKLIAPLETVAYWYVGHRGKGRVRFHKRVYFFLMEYQSGQVSDHDHEVNEARWFPLEDALTTLAFKGERQAVAQAAALLAEATPEIEEETTE